MSYINCPECRRIISDKVDSCPGCGFPVGEFTDPSVKNEPEDGVSYVVYPEPGQDGSSAPEKKKISRNTTDSIRTVDAPARRKRRVYAAAAAAVLAAAICTGVIVSVAVHFSSADPVQVSDEVYDNSEVSAAPAPFDPSDTHIAGSEVRYNDRFMLIESSEKTPFVAVVEDREYFQRSGIPFYYYVYVVDGQASRLIETEFEGSDIKTEDKFSVCGILGGYEIGEDDIVRSTVNTEYEDDLNVYHTSAAITTNIRMNDDVTGLLFYDLPVEESRRGVTGGFVTIYKGSGKAHDEVYDLDLGTDSINTEFIPRYFIQYETIRDGDYSYESGPEINVDDSGDKAEISLRGSIRLNEPVSGSLLIRYELSGDKKMSINPAKGIKRATLSSGSASFNIHSEQEKSEDGYDPSFELDIIGIIRIVPLGDGENG